MKPKIALILFVCALCILLSGFAAGSGNTFNLAENALLIPPLPADGGKIPVTVSFRLINLSEINEEEQHFNVVGYLSAVWKDPRLAYAQKSPSDVYHIYKPDEIWLPLFDFVNGIVPHSAYDITVRAYPDGTVHYYERSSAELSNEFFLVSFPFDSQKFKIMIQPSVSQENIVQLIIPNNTNVISASKGAIPQKGEWIVTGLKAKVENVKGLIGSSVTRVQFTIDMKRQWEFYVYKVMTPLLLMLILSWTVYWMNFSELCAQVEISITTNLTVIAFSYAIASRLPRVPYFTFIDSFFFVIYFFVFIVGIMIIVIHHLNKTSHKFAVKVQYWTRIINPLTFLLIIMLMVHSYKLLPF